MKAPLGAFFVFLALVLSDAPAQTVVQGEPFGYVKLSVTAGTGTSKRNTLISIPLLDEANITGRSTGRITGVGANTLTVADAGWAAGELSTLPAPYLLEITSGAARGRMLLLSTSVANTADTVTLHVDEAQRVGDLRNLGIVTGGNDGDTFRIRPVDTLSSFFGTPETTLVLGGTAANNADTITIVGNGSAVTYFYNINLGRWTRIGLGDPDASHVPIPPYTGVQYSRLANRPLEFIVTGKVPSGQRAASIKNSGTTLLSPFWPVSQTLASLALQNTTNWVSGATPDTVTMSAGGSVNTFFYDGSNWRRMGLGNPLANTNVVPAGASVMINKRGGGAGFSTYLHAAPYDLP